MKNFIPILLTIALFLLFTQQANAGVASKILQFLVEMGWVSPTKGMKETGELVTRSKKSPKESGTNPQPNDFDFYDLQYFSNKVARENFRSKKEDTRCHRKDRKIIKTDTALILEKPNMDSRLIGKFEKDESICVREEHDEWVKTNFGWTQKSNF